MVPRRDPASHQRHQETRDHLQPAARHLRHEGQSEQGMEECSGAGRQRQDR